MKEYKEFAHVCWVAKDIMDYDESMTEEEAEEWLSEHEERLQDIMIGRAWDYIYGNLRRF